MKTLILVRHAKTETGHSKITDRERNLLNRGVNDAHHVSLKLLDKKIVPDLIISSPANRAIETAGIFAENFDYPKNNIQVKELIYDHYTTNDFINMLCDVPNKHERVMVVGHNPGFEILAYRFTNEFNKHLPTTGIIGIKFEVKSWKEVEAGKGKFDFFYYPKNV
jgi:phosphohistidine phosphatase